MKERAITTIELVKSQDVSAGSSGIYGPVDLRDISRQGDFSLSYTIGMSGGSATCGTSSIEVQGCAYWGGTYVTPADGVFASAGASGGSGIVAFSPPVMPFMKIKVNVGTNGTANVSASLHVR